MHAIMHSMSNEKQIHREAVRIRQHHKELAAGKVAADKEFADRLTQGQPRVRAAGEKVARLLGLGDKLTRKIGYGDLDDKNYTRMNWERAYRSNIRESVEHYQQNEDEYRKAAVKDAAARGIEINASVRSIDLNSVELNFDGDGNIETQGLDQEARMATAAKVAMEYGQYDGDHSKQWALDQVVRALAGKGYEDVVTQFEARVEGEIHEWDTGRAP